MAKRKRAERVEPSWGEPARGGALRARREDRIVEPARGKRRPPAKQLRRRRGLFRPFARLAYWGVVFSLWGAIAAGAAVVWFGAKLPSADSWAVPDRPPNVKVQAAGGELLANRGMMGGEAVGLHAMSPFIPQAVVAIEDRRFRAHWGVDPVGLVRALVGNLVEGRVAQGGSTLTQQLAKNLFLKPERTLERKVQEVLLAFWLERNFSKDQILEMYLNRVYFGSGAYGVEAASRRYFGKGARDVSLGEAAVLAGLLKAPSRLSPARDAAAAEARAQVVLAAMRDQGLIADRDMTGAMSAPSPSAPAFWTGSEQWVADLVTAELPRLVGEVRQDLVVETTVDLALQKHAEAAIRDLLREKGEALRVSEGALVALDGRGRVRALVGGADYGRSQFDRARRARRQPGSAFKPFVFLAAIEAGLTPDTVRLDRPVRIGKWSPGNHEDKYYGDVSLSFALAKSLNTVAATLAAEVGVERVRDTAKRLGITSPLGGNLSIALGTSEVTALELTGAYVPFANGGFRPEPHVIERVLTAEGKTLYERGREKMPRVVSPEAVGAMNRMMSDTITLGTARRAAIGRPAAGKTGTTQNARDAWFVGYTAQLVAGVWFGNDDGTPMRDVTGGSLPTLAWKRFMEAAHEGTAPKPLPGTDLHPPPALAGAERLEPAPASIRRPVPPLDVGESGRKPGSILDIILGH